MPPLPEAVGNDYGRQRFITNGLPSDALLILVSGLTRGGKVNIMKDRGFRMPNLLLAGFQKCGSTTLSELLASHPGVDLAEGKEPNIFLHSDETSYVQRATAAFPAPRSARYRCDASITYALSDGAVLRAAHWCPDDTRIVRIVRDPVERTLSAYLHLKKRMAERRGIVEILKALPSQPEAIRSAEVELALWAMQSGELSLFRRLNFHDDVLLNALYVSNSQYILHLERLRRAFGADSIMCVRFEELVAEPNRVLDRLAAFLALEPFPNIDVPEKRQNPTYMPRGIPVAGRTSRATIALHKLRHAFSLTSAEKLGAHAFPTIVRQRVHALTAPASRALFDDQGWTYEGSAWDHGVSNH